MTEASSDFRLQNSPMATALGRDVEFNMHNIVQPTILMMWMNQYRIKLHTYVAGHYSDILQL